MTELEHPLDYESKQLRIKEQKRKRYQDNKKEIAIAQKIRYEANKANILIKQKEYCKLHKNEIAQYKKDYSIINRLKISQQRRQFRNNNKDKIRDQKLKCTYNISSIEYSKLFNKQNGCCAICDKHQSDFKYNLCVDHDHKTGKIRGLLCNECNRGIGYLKDNPNLLNKGATYILSYV